MTSTCARYKELMLKARHYHERALWQEKLRVLQDALHTCKGEDFLESKQCQQEVLIEIGGIRRRFGQYDQSIRTLEEALSLNLNQKQSIDPLRRARILGELVVVYRHSNKFDLARQTAKEQAEAAGEHRRLALQQKRLALCMELQADAETCRAIGNEGMCAYNLFQAMPSENGLLLEKAFQQLEQRIELAKRLHTRASDAGLCVEDPEFRYIKQSKAWQTIGLDHLSLCHIAKGHTQLAVDTAAESQKQQGPEENRDDPTVNAFSKFFYGNALWHHGQEEQAREQWKGLEGQCSSAMALCKEPAAEHAEYLKLMADAGLDLDKYDEQGFSALDYAVLGSASSEDQSAGNQDAINMIGIIEDSCRKKWRKKYDIFRTIADPHTGEFWDDEKIDRKVEEDIKLQRRQANIRSAYRRILQDFIRPELRLKMPGHIPRIRQKYAELLKREKSLQQSFDWFHFVPYVDFEAAGRLPSDPYRTSTERWARRVRADSLEKDFYVIFFSYRWIGNEYGRKGPDDAHRTQYRRMLAAVQAFVKKLKEYRKDFDENKVGLWLDCACIDQQDNRKRQRGIDSLPLAVIQCDAMISLVDETYHQRAWCGVEVMLTSELISSYPGADRKWQEHRLHSPTTDRVGGVLEEGNLQINIDISKLKCTMSSDRPKIDFLMRQSKLLGRDRA